MVTVLGDVYLEVYLHLLEFQVLELYEGRFVSLLYDQKKGSSIQNIYFQ